ncbi:4'-phosphopantetheinyl transferase superfamily protein [Vibrio brasiliensis]|uniref:4'-phosphopantetheinyl transferase family protein n=1 Tax=Vibrio brasiliensis TaxID=170652 RepID=UPI001EFCFA9B|nr:4'-phosphopantetheinyl transferase superfamily protein [Vibrio brasiliensis]
MPKAGMLHIERYRAQSGRAVLSQCQFDLSECDLELAATLNIALPVSVQRSVAKRRAEFIAGRYMASLSLSALSVVDQEVLIGSHREPLWPQAMTGAISHTGDRAVALVAEREAHPFVGIDVEHWLDARTAAEIGSQICQEREWRLLIEQGLNREQAISLIFSAKESLFKATFPFIGRYFGFESACVVEFDWAEQILILALEPFLAQYCSGQRVFRCQFFCQTSTVTTVILSAPER